MESMPSARRFWLVLTGTILVGLSAAQAIFDALRGTGVLRSLPALAGAALLGLVGLAVLVWLIRRRHAIEGGLDRLAAPPKTWLQKRRTMSLAIWIGCLAVLPIWVQLGSIGEGRDLLPRLAAFWWLSLLAAVAVPIARDGAWVRRWAMSALAIGTTFEVSTFLYISTDPFSLGWSEASRYYYASLFFAPRLYGEWLPLPILHPTRYLLQSVPFLIPGSPIWLHRLWQVILWLGITYGAAWLLARRIAWSDPKMKVWAALWLGLFFFQGAVYYHLMLSAVLILLLFDPSHTWRSLAVVALASIWSGVSRVNWIPVPGMLAVVLYAIEKRQPASEGFIAYWKWPVLWAVGGAVVGLAAQSAYVALSGNPASDFGTAFSSALLWYRLLPNPTFPMGVLPAIALAVFPLTLWAVLGLRRGEVEVRGWRLASLAVILGVLLVGGLVVSVKIGGGGDLHNFDAFLVLLAVCGAYVGFDTRLRPASIKAASSSLRPWWGLVLLVTMPMVFLLNSGGPPISRDAAHESQVLSAIQTAADKARSAGEPVLFLTERQLVTFGEIHAGPLQPEDEKVTLMEMAMSNNAAYLSRFHQAIASQRYGLIVSEPLAVQTQGSSHAFGEENDAWSQDVAKPILCAYQPVFKSDDPPVQLLVPRADASACAP